MAANSQRSFPIPSSACGIPSTAAAYSLNFTVVPQGPLGLLTAWPTGQALPNVSTLNSYSGTVVANAAIVPAGTGGAISVYVSNTTDVLFDIDGYFAPPATSGLQFYPVAPCRIADTRAAAGFTGAFGPPSLAANIARSFPIPSSACGVPSSAAAYSFNFTVVPSGYLGLLTTWPTGGSMPNVSTLNSYSGVVVANAALVPSGTGGAINVQASQATDLLLDINGYFALPGASGLNFYPVTPCRVADTRAAAGFTGAFGPPTMTANSQRSFPVPSSACGIPATAGAYSFNFTVVPPAPLDQLTTWPTGSSMPNVSTLNDSVGTVLANAAIVPAGSGGAISVFVTNTTDVLFDVNGYFAPASASAVNVTMTSIPAGLSLTIDSGTCPSTPCVYSWSAGSAHTIAASTQSVSSDTRYAFSSWSDAGAASHTVMPSSATTYTAIFTTQYLLTTKASPSTGGYLTPASGAWYNANQAVPLGEAPAYGYRFTNFTNAGGSMNGISITMSGPSTVTGVFNIAAGMTSALIACAAGAGNTCNLDSGDYIVDSNQPISVATNVTISGGGAGPANTRLVRGPNQTLPLMQIGENGYAPNLNPLTGITIQNLTFCGGFASSIQNPTGIPPHLGCANPPSPTSAQCVTAPNCDGDLVISNTSAATWSAPPGAPFNSSGTYHVTITNTAFADAIHGHPIFITPKVTGQRVNDVHITNSFFSGGNVQHGTFASSVWLGDHTQCDNWPSGSFADDPGTGLPPRNIRFDGNRWDSGRGGISGIARYLTIDHNTFSGYYWPGDDVGGTIEQEGCADKVNITNNTIDGAWTSGSVNQGGMELYGRNIFVSNNVVKNQAWGGISILSTYHAQVIGNHLWNNGQAGEKFPHIQVATSFPGDGTCNPRPVGGSACDAVRDTDGPIVQNNDSSDPANGNAVQPSPLTAKGVWLDGGNEGSTSNMINLANSAISGNSMTLATSGSQVVASERVAVNGLPVSINGSENSSVTSIVGSGVLIDTSDPTPHTIAVFPEGQQPLGSSLCYTDSTRRCFQFGGNDPASRYNFVTFCTDPQNPNCYTSFQGFFDTAVNTSPLYQLGGPYATSNACKFIYYPGGNVLYLDDASGSGAYPNSRGEPRTDQRDLQDLSPEFQRSLRTQQRPTNLGRPVLSSGTRDLVHVRIGPEQRGRLFGDQPVRCQWQCTQCAVVSLGILAGSIEVNR